MKFLDFLAPSPQHKFKLPAIYKAAYETVVGPLFDMGIISMVAGGAVLADIHRTEHGDVDVCVLIERKDILLDVEAFLKKNGFVRCGEDYKACTNSGVYFNKKTDVNVILSEVGATKGSDIFKHFDLDICKVAYTPWHTYVKTDEFKAVIETKRCDATKATPARVKKYQLRYPAIDFLRKEEDTSVTYA